jgi:hypothetical protein
MISKKSILLSMVMAVMAASQGALPSFAMEEQQQESEGVTVHDIKSGRKEQMRYNPGETWGALAERAERLFGHPGQLMHNGERHSDDDTVKSGLSKINALIFVPHKADV